MLYQSRRTFCWCRENPKLLPQAQIVSYRQMFNQLAIPQTHDVHLLLPNSSTGRGDLHKGPSMRSRPEDTSSDSFAFSDQFLDVGRNIRKGSMEHSDQLPHCFWPAIGLAGRSLLVEIVSRKELVCQGGFSLCEQFRPHLPDNGLVSFFCFHRRSAWVLFHAFSVRAKS
jgi:hypothetical protein